MRGLTTTNGDASRHPVFLEGLPQFPSLCELFNVTGTLQKVGHQSVTNIRIERECRHLEAHLTMSQKEAISDPTMLQCSTETCT